MDLVQSNFNRLTPLGLTSASQDMKLTCSIWLAFLRCALEDRGRFRLTAGSTALWGNIVWLVVNHRRCWGHPGDKKLIMELMDSDPILLLRQRHID